MPRTRIPVVAFLVVGVISAGAGVLARSGLPPRASVSRLDDDQRNTATKPEFRDAAEEQVEQGSGLATTANATLADAVRPHVVDCWSFFQPATGRLAGGRPPRRVEFIRGPPLGA